MVNELLIDGNNSLRFIKCLSSIYVCRSDIIHDTRVPNDSMSKPLKRECAKDSSIVIRIGCSPRTIVTCREQGEDGDENSIVCQSFLSVVKCESRFPSTIQSFAMNRFFFVPKKLQVS